MWQNKRNNKRQKTQDNQDGDKKNTDYELNSFDIGSKKFEEYYRAQFEQFMKDEDEFQLFYKTLQNKLPVAFRVNPSLVNYESLVDLFQDP